MEEDPLIEELGNISLAHLVQESKYFRLRDWFVNRADIATLVTIKLEGDYEDDHPLDVFIATTLKKEEPTWVAKALTGYFGDNDWAYSDKIAVYTMKIRNALNVYHQVNGRLPPTEALKYYNEH